MLTRLAIAVLIGAGAGLALVPVGLRVRLAAKVAVSAVTVHILLAALLSASRLEAALHELVYRSPAPLGLLIAAIVESTGLWSPVLYAPWAERSARALTGLALVSASVIAAESFYFPFDILEINGVVVSPSRIEYFVLLMACLSLAGLGYLGAWVVRELRPSGKTA